MTTVATIPSTEIPSRVTGQWIKNALAKRGFDISAPVYVSPRQAGGDCPCLYAIVFIEGKQYELTSTQSFKALARAVKDGHDLIVSYTDVLSFKDTRNYHLTAG